MIRLNHLIFLLSLICSVLFIAESANKDSVATVYVRTGSILFAGTDANIPCLSAPVCAITISSDNTGVAPYWFVDNVEVMTTGHKVAPSQRLFIVGQWLSLNHLPNTLNVTINECPGLLEGVLNNGGASSA